MPLIADAIVYLVLLKKIAWVALEIKTQPECLTNVLISAHF